MSQREYRLFVGLPPGTDDLAFLEEAAGSVEPLLDLRYGTPEYKRSMVEAAVRRDLRGLTVSADHRNNLTDFLLEALPAHSRVILTHAGRNWQEIRHVLTEFATPRRGRRS